MDIFLVSDDTYFLMGMQNFTASLPSIGSVTFSKISRWDREQNQLNPESGDVVLVNISNIYLRRKFIRLPAMSNCRLVIMARLNGLNPIICKAVFPQIVAWNIQPSELINLLRRIMGDALNKHHVPKHTMEVFDLLVKEYSLADISDRMQMNEKYIYAIKRRFLQQLGLGKCNSSVASMFCHEILHMATGVDKLNAEVRMKL